jgi:hypothetical protein
MKTILHVRGSRIVAAYDYNRQQGRHMRKSGEPIDPRWPDIIQAVADNLSFFTEKGIKPTVRAMFYRLYSLEKLRNTHNEYVSFSEETAIARRGYEWDDINEEWKECKKYIKLDINCFADESRWPLKHYDDSDPIDPIDPKPPKDPEDYIHSAIHEMKMAPYWYSGKGIPGTPGVEPGRWYNQEYYVEVWIEKQTLGPTIEVFLKDKDVNIIPNKGNSSVTFIHDNCMRLKGYVDNGKQVAVLYIGDMDPSGDAMDEQMKREFQLWGLDPDIFKRIAITQEQLKEFKKIPTDPDSDTIFKLVGGTDPKTGKPKKGDPRTPGYIDKYSKYINPGRQLPPVAEVEAFLAYYPDEFKEMIRKAVDEKYWDEDVYNDSFPREPGEEFDDIDPDNELFDDTEETIREMMFRKITESFKPGWKN